MTTQILTLGVSLITALTLGSSASSQPQQVGVVLTGIVKMDRNASLDVTLITVLKAEPTSPDELIGLFLVQGRQGDTAPEAETGPAELLYEPTRLLIAFESGSNYLFQVAGRDRPLPKHLASATVTYESAGIARYEPSRQTHDALAREFLGLEGEARSSQIIPMIGNCSGCWTGGPGAASCSLSCAGESCSVSCNTQIGYWACCQCAGYPRCTCCRGSGDGHDQEACARLGAPMR